MHGTGSGPFSEACVPEIHLTNAPLALVLAQLRFPGANSVLKYSTADDRPLHEVIGPLAQAGFPLVEEGRQMMLTITPDGVTQAPGDPIWTFRDHTRSYQLTLGPEFVSLHTTAYEGHEKFVALIRGALKALAPLIDVTGIQRVGFRYVNQFGLDSAVEAKSWVKPELLGGLAIDPGHATLVYALTQAVFAFDGVQPGTEVTDGIHARSGIVPPGTTLDAALPPKSETTWVLDLDAFTNLSVSSADADALADRVFEMSRRAYNFFRWAVSAEFISRFGGTQ